MKKKGLALAAASALLVVGVVAGSLAWLTDKTEAVTNVFTTSDINVTLEETKTDFKMVPGYTIDKDPKATVKSGSEECYLFVKIDKSDNFDTFMTYEVAEGWTKLETDKDGNTISDLVYYRTVANTGDDAGKVLSADKEFAILKGNQVSVKGTVTKSDMNGLTTSTYPTLTFTAYASQLHKNASETFTAAEAWANVTPASTTPTT